MAKLTPGPAIYCFECGGYTAIDQDTADALEDDYMASEACEHCMDENTALVDVTACPLGVRISTDSGAERCTADMHHWGLGVHISEPKV